LPNITDSALIHNSIVVKGRLQIRDKTIINALIALALRNLAFNSDINSMAIKQKLLRVFDFLII
jgi:hypothetical protein